MIKYILAIIAIVIFLVPSVYASGPRLDYDERYGDIPGALECWVDGYDAGFAGKYNIDRANECKEIPGDQYNASQEYGCTDSGLTKIDCDNIKDNPVDTGNPKSLKEENRRTCYDDGYEDGGNNAYDREREQRCSEFGDPYRDGFMAACQFGKTYDLCASLTEITQTQEQTNTTTVTDEQNDRYYEGLDWQEVCANPLVKNYISQPCEVLVTPDGSALTFQGKQEMENLLCPQGPTILSTIELFYGQIPESLENELSSACEWN